MFYVFFRNLPLRGLGDMLYKAPLYNIRYTQRACLGLGIPSVPRDHVLTIEKIISHFWNSEYNRDYIDNVNEYQKIPIANNYFTWQYYSKKNPMEIFRVEWIPFKTLKELTEDCIARKEQEEERNPHLFRGVGDIIDLFNESSITDEVEDDEEDDENDEELDESIVYGAANYYSINGFHIYIEDSFKIKGRRYFISSFVSQNKYTYEVTHLEVLNDKGKKLLFKLNSKIKKLIRDSMEEEYDVLEANLDGLTIKKGDIIKIVNPGGRVLFRRVLSLRYNLDGQLEARLADDYYLLERMKLVEVVDLGESTIYGEKVDEYATYLFLYQVQREPVRGFRTKYFPVMYEDTTLTDSGEMSHSFRGIGLFDGCRGTFPETPSTYHGLRKLYREDRLKRVPSVVRLGNNIKWSYTYDDAGDAVDAPVYFLEEEDIYLFQRESETRSLTQDEVRNRCFFNDDQSFFLHGVDQDLYFSVGDKVIVPNWGDPMEMLKTKTIVGFDFDSDVERIFAKVVDKKGNESKVSFIRCYRTSMRRYSKINFTAMYRVTNTYGVLQSGMKIKANQARVSNFPMKDVNIIIGFLIDLGLTEPLVLCSNGCTLWYSDIIEKFDITPFSDPKWKKMQHAIIDMSKIRPQPGDAYVPVYDSENPFIICNERHSNALHICNYERFFGDSGYIYMDNYSTDVRRHSRPYGILGPRYTQSQLMGMERIPGFATPFATVIYNERSELRFPAEGWRVKGYVQRLPEQR
jgi:hypothetical protein